MEASQAFAQNEGYLRDFWGYTGIIAHCINPARFVQNSFTVYEPGGPDEAGRQ